MRHELIAFALESAISAQLALFAAFLLSSAKRGPALYLLAALSGDLAVMVAANLLIGEVGWGWLADPVLFLDLAAPALFYLYVRQVRQPAPPLRRLDLVHAFPAFAGVLAWKTGILSSMDATVIACWTLYWIAGVAYFLRNQSGYAPAALRHFLVALASVLAAVTVLRVVMAYQALANEPFRAGTPYLFVLAAMFLATCQLMFTSLRYPGLLSAPGSHVKYAPSGVDAGTLAALEQRFVGLMRDRRPFSDPDLALAELAAMLGAPARQVSQLINARFGMNVSAYINKCRIDEAARLLTEAPDKPIKIVMHEAGFRSKSVFNREFQRCRGMSPSEYRELSSPTLGRKTLIARAD